MRLHDRVVPAVVGTRRALHAGTRVRVAPPCRAQDRARPQSDVATPPMSLVVAAAGMRPAASEGPEPEAASVGLVAPEAPGHPRAGPGRTSAAGPVRTRAGAGGTPALLIRTGTGPVRM